MTPQDSRIFIGSDKQQSSPKGPGDVRIRLLGPLQTSVLLAAPAPRGSERGSLGAFPARILPQTQDRIAQTGSLFGIMLIQSFCLADEICNRAITPRSPRVEGLCPSERIGLMARSGHHSIVQVAPSLEASPHNASKQGTSCYPGKHIASLRRGYPARERWQGWRVKNGVRRRAVRREAWLLGSHRDSPTIGSSQSDRSSGSFADNP
jgi:hypothetical protein